MATLQVLFCILITLNEAIFDFIEPSSPTLVPTNSQRVISANGRPNRSRLTFEDSETPHSSPRSGATFTPIRASSAANSAISDRSRNSRCKTLTDDERDASSDDDIEHEIRIADFANRRVIPKRIENKLILTTVEVATELLARFLEFISYFLHAFATLISPD